MRNSLEMQLAPQNAGFRKVSQMMSQSALTPTTDFQRKGKCFLETVRG
ncbi:hypothetical protein [Leptolyngbya sp. O-77]|nr:hypothetical protein [Leptolyngbya sp. O-77]